MFEWDARLEPHRRRNGRCPTSIIAPVSGESQATPNPIGAGVGGALGWRGIAGKVSGDEFEDQSGSDMRSLGLGSRQMSTKTVIGHTPYHRVFGCWYVCLADGRSLTEDCSAKDQRVFRNRDLRVLGDHGPSHFHALYGGEGKVGAHGVSTSCG